MNNPILWKIRHFVYNHFADTTYPPNVDITAQHFNISAEEASEYYKALNTRHAFFLDPGTVNIRMAWPFSAVPTNFKVHANGKTYYANCAWDMLGIPVILQSDATAEAVCTGSNDSIKIEIKNGNIAPTAVPGGVHLRGFFAKDATLSSLRIHFPLPFTHWYDDLVFT